MLLTTKTQYFNAPSQDASSAFAHDWKIMERNCARPIYRLSLIAGPQDRKARERERSVHISQNDNHEKIIQQSSQQRKAQIQWKQKIENTIGKEKYIGNQFDLLSTGSSDYPTDARDPIDEGALNLTDARQMHMPGDIKGHVEAYGGGHCHAH